MGFGDEVMAAGRAERMARELGYQVCIVDRQGFPRWHPLWEGNPHIAKQVDSKVACLVDGAGARAYIQYPFTSEGHGYTDWRARDHRGKIYLSEAEKALAARCLEKHGDFVLIEPNIKLKANPNKVWPWANWQELIKRLPLTFLQVGPPGTKHLPGAVFMQTNTFREACAVLSVAKAFVGSEGGLHHAAAALGVKAVVIFGGSPSVAATGYPEHYNLGGTNPCGRWQPCQHCRKAMDAITVDEVLKGLQCQLSS